MHCCMAVGQSTWAQLHRLRLRPKLYADSVCDAQRLCSCSMRLLALYKSSVAFLLTCFLFCYHSTIIVVRNTRVLIIRILWRVTNPIFWLRVSPSSSELIRPREQMRRRQHQRKAAASCRAICPSACMRAWACRSFGPHLEAPHANTRHDYEPLRLIANKMRSY